MLTCYSSVAVNTPDLMEHTVEIFTSCNLLQMREILKLTKLQNLKKEKSLESTSDDLPLSVPSQDSLYSIQFISFLYQRQKKSMMNCSRIKTPSQVQVSSFTLKWIGLSSG